VGGADVAVLSPFIRVIVIGFSSASPPWVARPVCRVLALGSVRLQAGWLASLASRRCRRRIVRLCRAACQQPWL
jgi:hypothetical protein